MGHSTDSLAQYVLCLTGTGSRGCNLRISALTISFQHYTGGSRQSRENKSWPPYWIWGFPGDASGEEPACQCKRLIRDMVRSLVWKGLLEEGMTTHSAILA